ncbi:DUF1275 family protein [Sphingobacterium faecium NBRC 15299]|uniref:YoaK family protein n=1 Tax=Sphingobacterium faecium TaxID=34087 RepID=UPI000D370C82|nr:YoaK family protein [Sphingobacterium faecium]PTX10126.1 uncharacterized membrane protein YoaK (UPF0700 family) [Sphingobacterium faecium]GEM66012.1 DUF1275 family protein [Sphingobacterium faecium NBRC 15299]
MDHPCVKPNNLDTKESVRIQERLAIYLAFIAGYIDATGLIKWKIYVSFMSGNTTQLGVALSTDKDGVIMTSVIAISCFLLGIYAGACLSLWKKTDYQIFTCYIVSFMLTCYTIIAYIYTIHIGSSIAIIGFSTGLMNTIVTAVGNQKVNTDFVTGTLNSLARNTAMFSMTKDKMERQQYKTHAYHLSLVWIGFISGAYTASLLLDALRNWFLILPALLLLIAGLWLSSCTIKP